MATDIKLNIVLGDKTLNDICGSHLMNIFESGGDKTIFTDNNNEYEIIVTRRKIGD